MTSSSQKFLIKIFSLSAMVFFICFCRSQGTRFHVTPTDAGSSSEESEESVETTGKETSSSSKEESEASAQRLEAERQQFLNTAPFLKASVDNRFSMGRDRSDYYNAPISPVVKNYHGGVPMCPLVVLFPKAFQEKIPHVIQQELKKYPKLKTIDILFTPQVGEGHGIYPDPALKVAYWALPTMPKSFEGTLFNHKLLMGIYEYDHPSIGKSAIKLNSLSKHSVHIHDDLISPNNAHIGLKESELPSSFWSLTVDHKRDRAAATLHWLLKREDANVIAGLITTGAVKNLASLVRDLRSNENFVGSSMLNKLEAITLESH